MYNNDIGMVADYLDANQNMRDFIEDIVEENFRELGEPLFDENNEFIYKKTIEEFIKTDNNIKNLTTEEYNLLLDMIIKDIVHKIEAKGNAHIQATSASCSEEYRNYYGSSESTYWHQLEHFLDDYNYNKTIYDFYNEYLEENKKEKIL